jgi:hypothetical protein
VRRPARSGRLHFSDSRISIRLSHKDWPSSRIRGAWNGPSPSGRGGWPTHGNDAPRPLYSRSYRTRRERDDPQRASGRKRAPRKCSTRPTPSNSPTRWPGRPRESIIYVGVAAEGPALDCLRACGRMLTREFSPYRRRGAPSGLRFTFGSCYPKQKSHRNARQCARRRPCARDRVARLSQNSRQFRRDRGVNIGRCADLWLDEGIDQ